MTKIYTHQYKTTSIGLKAMEILSKNQYARVWGKTSKGLFIKASSPWLVFISFDSYRGPLTILLDDVDSLLQFECPGCPVIIESPSILFQEQAIKITIDEDRVWRPLSPSTQVLVEHKRLLIVKHAVKEALSKKSGGAFGNYLHYVLRSSNTELYPQTENGLNKTAILELQNDIRNQNHVSLAGRLSNYLGNGPGLTPSADDFIIGLLLGLNRWQTLFWPTGNLLELNKEIVEAANEKTTLLSANLIECAALGLADERLIDALDLMVTGLGRESEVLRRLLGWGNSSGADVFAGMAAVITANGNEKVL
jgi:hypothetical protein